MQGNLIPCVEPETQDTSPKFVTYKDSDLHKDAETINQYINRGNVNNRGNKD